MKRNMSSSYLPPVNQQPVVRPWVWATIASLYVLLLYLLMGNQAPVFPRGGVDLWRMVDIVQGRQPFPGNSWLGDDLDRLLWDKQVVRTYAGLLSFRRLAISMGILALITWVWRTAGWLCGIWSALLFTVWHPVHVSGNSLGCEPFGFFLLGAGCLLVYAPPWSRHGYQERFVGGVLLGLAWGVTPESWYYSVVLLVGAVLAGGRDYERWLPLLLGWCSGVVPGWKESSLQILWGDLSGLTVSPWLGFVFPLPLLGLLLLGMAEIIKNRSWEPRGSLFWLLAFGGIVLTGRITPPGLLLATPVFVWLGIAGLRLVGRIFVSPLEQRLLPTALLVLIAYHTFFNGLTEMRLNQAFAREVQSLAQLISHKVPSGDAIALFRLTPLLSLVTEQQVDREWKTIIFEARDEWEKLLANKVREHGRLWVDPKRLAEEVGLTTKEVMSRLRQTYKVDLYVTSSAAELANLQTLY